MKKLAILMSVVMVVAFTAGVSLAGTAAKNASKVQMQTGEVVKVDAKRGFIEIKVNNKNETLKAEPKMLNAINAGDKVTIEKGGDTLKSIKPVQ